MARNYNLIDSLLSALNPLTLLGKIIMMLIYITVLAIDKLWEVGKTTEAGWLNVLNALYISYKYALFRAFGTIAPIIDQLMSRNYEILNHPITLGLTIFFFVLLILTVYQPVDWVIDILDGHRGKTTPFFFRLLVTIVVVMGFSLWVYYGLGNQGINNIVPTVNETINQTITNSSLNISEVPVINLN